MQIGNVKINKTAALAPMASVADRAYRLMCKSYGASYLVSEMISSKGLVFGDKKTGEFCTVTPAERPMALQLFGEEAFYMAKAADILNRFSPDIIDINMGCPVPKIAGSGSGSALMKDPKTAFEITRAVVSAAQCPVTVKIRAGWDESSKNAAEFAKGLEDAGAAAIAVHGRTKTQMYHGRADWSVIKDVKAAVKIPVIGNGDITCGKDAKRMYDETGCDLVMIGRASYGRPWVFRETEHYLKTGETFAEPSVEERVNVMLEHVRLIISNKGETQGMKEARKNIAWYLKGVKNAAEYRARSGSISFYSELEELADEMIKNERL